MTKSPSKTSALYLRLMQHVYPFWSILLLGIFANIFYSLIDAGFTYMMRPFIDKSFIQVDLTFIQKVPFILLVGITFRGIISALGSYCMTWVARSVVQVLRQNVFAHILKLPARYYDKAPSGHLLSRILYDVEQVAQVSADALTDLIQNICLVIGLLTVMFVICWQLSFMFLITVPFVGIIVNFTNRRVRRVSHKVQKNMGEVTEIASEVIEGYRVVRIFGADEKEAKKFNTAAESSRINDMKVASSKALNVAGVQTVIAIGIAAIILLAIQLSETIQISAGSFIAVIAAMLQLIKPVKTLTTLNATIQRGLAGAESVFTLLDEEPESQNGKQLKKRSKGALRFHEVSFQYDQGPSVLKKVSFSIEPGEMVAVVGHSGSGKTTLSSLIPRFYEITEGVITLDDEPISEMALPSLREQLALVTQHVTLFNDTIKNNIAYGVPNASDEDIIRAAKLSFSHEFISRLEKGYETKIGENGLLLSGGQRQRIAIARALLKDAPILILDEATSALDNQSELAIQDALNEVVKNRTTLVIAHRLSTIQKAHRILVMHEGRIIEEGSHESLIQKNGHYAELYRTHAYQIRSTLEAIPV